MVHKTVVIPAKSLSRRVPDKNWRPFSRGKSLVELKVLSAIETKADRIIVSTDLDNIPFQVRDSRVEFRSRSKHLCGDHVNLRELFHEVLQDFTNDVVFWAHPTSPFVKPSTIDKAMNLAYHHPGTCILGVREIREFLWKMTGPFNYNPATQPRSQDLEALFAVTGGIHCAFGRDFIDSGSVSFQPAQFIFLRSLESTDIDDIDDWIFAQALANVASNVEVIE